MTAAATSRARGYRATTTRVHDGDSFYVLADTGFGSRNEPELRLLDVHAPELTAARLALPPRGQPGGTETTTFVNSWLADAATTTAAQRIRWELWIETVMSTAPEPDERRTFTRYLATVWRITDCPTWGRPGPLEHSLNSQVTTFLTGRPDWPPGN